MRESRTVEAGSLCYATHNVTAILRALGRSSRRRDEDGTHVGRHLNVLRGQDVRVGAQRAGVAVSAPATTLVRCLHAHQHVAPAVEPTTRSCLVQASTCDEPEMCRWPWLLPIVLVEVGREVMEGRIRRG